MIYAFPGMGADRRMFPGPWLDLPDFTACDWTPCTGAKTLPEVALIMCEAHGIRDGDTLVGCSFGGMVACEITKIRSIPVLYLIGSATHHNEVSGLLALLHPLARVAPMDLLRWSAGQLPTAFAQMFAGADPAFIRAMCAAMFEWEGLGDSSTRVFRIHGKHDLLIPPPEKVDLLLDGRHMLSMTHAQQCVDFVRANQSTRPMPARGR